jgi:transposase-like protein
MAKAKKQYTKEFRSETVKLVAEGKRGVAELAKDLGLPEATIYRWVKQAKVDAGQGRPGELSTSELAELKQLRRKVQQLELEKEFLKKAAAFFAKENS